MPEAKSSTADVVANRKTRGLVTWRLKISLSRNSISCNIKTRGNTAWIDNVSISRQGL